MWLADAELAENVVAQHHSVRSVRTPHACNPPADTCRQTGPLPTRAGVTLPDAAAPQHHRVLPARIAQAWPPSAETRAQPLDDGR